MSRRTNTRQRRDRPPSGSPTASSTPPSNPKAPPTNPLCAQCGEATPAAAPLCAVCGQDPRLDSRYRLEALLGRGANGATYRARRLADGALFALKELPLHRAESLKALELFEREARVLQSLRHPNIPRFVDTFTVGLGKQMMLCIVQELIEGETLEHERATRRYTEREVLEVLAAVLPTLEHLAGLRPPVIHRDIKPSNLMRRRDGRVALIDFGSVRDAIKDSLVGGSTVAGTFGYMAPEQFIGQASPATDIYGLGATALSLLAGVGAERLIGSGNRLEWRNRVPMSDGLASLLTAMLDPEPRRRPSAPRALERVAALLPIASPASSPPARDSRASQVAPAPRQRPTPTAPAPLSTPSSAGLVSSARWVIGIVLVAVASLVGYAISTGHYEGPAAPLSLPDTPVEAARPRAPLAPPKGLSFAMTVDEVRALLPELDRSPNAHGEALPKYSGHEGLELNKYDLRPAPGETPMPGLAYPAKTQIGERPATCRFRFWAEGTRPQTLSMFVCKIWLNPPANETELAALILEGWVERVGEPDFNSIPPRHPSGSRYFSMGEARWRDSDASLWLKVSPNEVALMGATMPFLRHLTALVEFEASEKKLARIKAEADERRRLEREKATLDKDL